MAPSPAAREKAGVRAGPHDAQRHLPANAAPSPRPSPAGGRGSLRHSTMAPTLLPGGSAAVATMTDRIRRAATLLSAALACLAACTTTPPSPQARDVLQPNPNLHLQGIPPIPL